LSPSNVLEPTYQAIRQRLLAGAWPMGFRLETGKLAHDLGVSITPVRDSLNRLVGEDLVDLVPGMGFHVPHMTEGNLCDLLDLNLFALEMAVELGGPGHDALPADLPGSDHAVRTDFVFTRIAAASGNSEIAGLVTRIGARLHGTRLNEASVLDGADEELERIQNEAQAIRRGPALVELLRRYHLRRKQAARGLVARLLS